MTDNEIGPVAESAVDTPNPTAAGSSVAKPVTGAFMESLVRNNKKIREDRALAIAKNARVKFRRAVEDLDIRIDEMETEREGMLDLSPENVTTLIVASEFDADEFVRKDIQLGVDIRNLKIKRDVAKERCEHLFGKE